jgi:hypothetical protein
VKSKRPSFKAWWHCNDPEYFPHCLWDDLLLLAAAVIFGLAAFGAYKIFF